jgi:hypothetical protein
MLAGSAAPGEAHLFHFANVRSRETQVARDFRLIKELTQWGTKDFGLAAAVYRGEVRPRERRPSEPGYLLKAEYQRRASSPPLRALIQAMDRRLGTSVNAEIETALARRDPLALEAALRKFFYAEIREILGGLERHLIEPQVADVLFGVLADYLFTSYEVFLALQHPNVYRQVKGALGHLRESLPRAEPLKAAAPAEFERAHRRLERLLRSVTFKGGYDAQPS